MSTIINLPKISYDFSIQNENPLPIILPDLIVRFNYQFLTSERQLALFNYTILDGETPEIISYKFYETTDYNELIMLVNNKFDYLADFPMKDESIEDFVKDKYGVDKTLNIHHYEDPYGNVCDEFYYDWRNSNGTQPKGTYAHEPIYKMTTGGSSPVYLRNVPAYPISNMEYEIRENDKRRSIKLIKTNYIIQFYREYVAALNTA